MSTELQRQIVQLHSQRINAQPIHKGRPSLFLTPKEAAAVDVEEVFDAGFRGIVTLQQQDDRFASFTESLFHPSSVKVQRELQSVEENKALDKEINRILQLLSLYIDDKTSHRVLEYLIRRYLIHELNVDALVRCVLPIHNTKVMTYL